MIDWRNSNLIKEEEDEVDEGGLSGAMIDCRNSNMPDSSVFVIEEECIEEEACWRRRA